MNYRTVRGVSFLFHQLTPNKRFLFSDKKISKVHSTKQTSDPHNRPLGLWYGCGSEWIQYLIESFPEDLESTRYLYRLHLDTTGVLKVRDRNVEAVTKKYGVDIGGGFELIDWKKVAKSYSGFEACPFSRFARLPSWYTSIAVASGCVWNTCAITHVELVLDAKNLGSLFLEACAQGWVGCDDG